MNSYIDSNGRRVFEIPAPGKTIGDVSVILNGRTLNVEIRPSQDAPSDSIKSGGAAYAIVLKTRDLRADAAEMAVENGLLTITVPRKTRRRKASSSGLWQSVMRRLRSTSTGQ